MEWLTHFDLAAAMNWLFTNWAAVSTLGYATVSEIIAIRQFLKYPDNDGFGGVLAGIMKFFQKKAPVQE
jgi:hypothetical protein